MKVIKADKFFEILKNLGLRKSNKIYENLLHNIQLARTVKDTISIEKIKKFIKEADSN